MVFIPTYLYIKQHSITGKLYFGKTTRTESKMLTYKGSGKHWKRHINAYGNEYVVTLWYKLYDNVFDLVADALSMSKSYDIVNNESWLNLKLENGLDGCLTGKYHHMFGKVGKLHHNFGKIGTNNPLYGIPKSPEHNLKNSIANRGKPKTQAQLDSVRKPQTPEQRERNRLTQRNLAKKFNIMDNFNIEYINITIREFAEIHNYNPKYCTMGLTVNKQYKGNRITKKYI
jgi:hypothetical protein